MFNSIDTSSGEIHNIGCDPTFPKFIDYHNQPSPSTNLPYYSPVNSPYLRNPLPEVSRDQTGNYENRQLYKLPKEVIDRASTLVALNISDNKFEYFPLEILQIKTLHTLKLDHNKIKSIPSDIAQLTNLESLSLAHNGLQLLPVAISKLKRLKELNLECNLLDSLPQEIDGLRNLKILNIYQNRLDSLPTTFGNLSALNSLCLEWFRYTEPKMAVFQRGSNSEAIINKVRKVCCELQSKGNPLLMVNAFIEALSAIRVNFRALDLQSRTIIHTACLYEDISIVKFFIAFAPELMDSCDKNQMTPLCLSLLERKT